MNFNSNNSHDHDNNNNNAALMIQEFESLIFSKTTTHDDHHFVLEDEPLNQIGSYSNSNNGSHYKFGCSDDMGVPEALNPNSPFSRSVSPSDNEGLTPSSSPSTPPHFYSSSSSTLCVVPDPVQQQQQLKVSHKASQKIQSTKQEESAQVKGPSPYIAALAPFIAIPSLLPKSAPAPQKRSSHLTPEEEEEERRRVTKRQKNNEAAQKCRLKKKQADVENLERNKILEKENAELRKELERLQTETKCLKDIIITLSANKANS